MKKFPRINNERGSLTPFMVIVAAVFLMIFIQTYQHYYKLAKTSVMKGYLQVASEDLLAGFHQRLFSDYGLLAYQDEDVEMIASDSIRANIDVNEKSYFFRDEMAVELENELEVTPEETLKNQQLTAELCTEIASYHLPDEIIEELNGIYKWTDKLKEISKEQEAISCLIDQVQKLQKYVDRYRRLVDDINNIEKWKDWIESTDPGRACYKIEDFIELHEDAIDILEDLETGLREGRASYKKLSKQVKNPKMKRIMNKLDFSKSSFAEFFSESGDYSINQVKRDLRSNVRKLKEIEDTLDFDALDELTLDFFVGEEDDDDGWKRFVDDLKRNIDFDLSETPFTGEIVASDNIPERLDLSVMEHLFLNEYFLGVLTKYVESEVRDFDMLTRDDRESVFDQGEVEFLITGRKKSKTHIQLRIFAFRMGANMVSLMMDKEKVDITSKIGTAIGFWFPGGTVVGTGVVMVAWTGVESSYDVKQLYASEGIPFIKTDADWHYDIDFEHQSKVAKDVANKKGTREKNDLLCYYNDYLRILLMLTPGQTKMSRFQKIVEDNLSETQEEAFKLKNMIVEHSIDWKTMEIRDGYY